MIVNTVQITSTQQVKREEFLDNSFLESQYESEDQSMAEVPHTAHRRHAVKAE